jgi:hypothetical protein
MNQSRITLVMMYLGYGQNNGRYVLPILAMPIEVVAIGVY